MATKVAFLVVLTIALLLAGGYWVKRWSNDTYLESLQASAYESYLEHTQPPAAAPEAAPTTSAGPSSERRPAALPAQRRQASEDSSVQASAKIILEAIARGQKSAL